MVTKTFQLETLTCPTCSSKIEGMLKKTEGVGAFEVMFNSSRARVSFDENVIDSEELKKKFKKLGYKVLGEK